MLHSTRVSYLLHPDGEHLEKPFQHPLESGAFFPLFGIQHLRASHHILHVPPDLSDGIHAVQHDTALVVKLETPALGVINDALTVPLEMSHSPINIVFEFNMSNFMFSCFS